MSNEWLFRGQLPVIFSTEGLSLCYVSTEGLSLCYDTLKMEQLRDAMIAEFGSGHVFDPLPALQALSSGSADDTNDVAAGLVPRSILLTQNAGEVHLNTSAMDAVATAPEFLQKVSDL